MSYCLGCHSQKEQKGELDLERFTSPDNVRKDVKPWQAMILQLETGEMPPKDRPQPTAEQRKLLIDWTRRLLDDEARARAGDPGRVPLRRLSNTLSMSPALTAKYVGAAKEIASHAVLLPDGFRFSPTKTRRDWTDESLTELRKFYWQFTRDGSLPLQPYVSALVRHREELLSGKIKLETVAANEKLSPKYLAILWQALTGQEKSYPLDQVRARWRPCCLASTTIRG